MALSKLDAVWADDQEDKSYDVAWGDMDNDGDLDLAVAYADAPSKVYLNNGGTLQGTPVWTDTLIRFTYSVDWGDMDGDGYLDLALGNQCVEGDFFDCRQNVVFTNTLGTLGSSPAWTSGEFEATVAVAWGDVDLDGDLDLAVGNGTFVPDTFNNTTQGDVNRLYLNQNGQLSTFADWTSADAENTLDLAWGDVDGDGDLDLAAANYANGDDAISGIGQFDLPKPRWHLGNQCLMGIE